MIDYYYGITVANSLESTKSVTGTYWWKSTHQTEMSYLAPLTDHT